MEEIYNKMNEMIELGKQGNQEDLNKQIIDTETELDQVNSQLQFIQSSLTRPILENNQNELENKLNDLRNEKKANEKEKSENFKKDKEELIELIDEKLGQFKSKSEINNGLENVKQEKEKWSALLAETTKKRNAVMEKIKSTGYVDNNLDSLTQKIKMAETKLQELATREEELNGYKTIEDNIEDIQDIEYLKMRVSGYDVNDIEKIAKDSFYKKIAAEKAKAQENEKTENIPVDENKKVEDEQNPEKDNDGTEHTVEENNAVLEPEVEETNEKIHDNKTKDPFEIIVSPEEQAKIEEEYEKEHKNTSPLNNEKTKIPDEKTDVQENNNENVTKPAGQYYAQAKIKRIIIGKGITIENKNGQQEKFKFKRIRKNIKAVEEGKLSEIQEMIRKISPNYPTSLITKQLGKKIDPNVLFALQKATEDYGISRWDANNIMSSYVKALSGDKQKQEEIKDFITYDRTRMDVWRPSSFLGKIRNEKWFEKLNDYKEEARKFAKIIEDKPRRTFRQWLTASKPVQLLGEGTGAVADTVKKGAEHASEIYDKKKTQATEFKNKLKAESEIDKTQVMQGTTRWEPIKDTENKKDNKQNKDVDKDKEER